MYVAEFSTIYSIIICFLIVWSIIGLLIKKTYKQWLRQIGETINALGAAFAVCGILSYTGSTLGQTPATENKNAKK